jgi:hypothetical protein
MRLLIESDHPYERVADYVRFVDAGMDVVVCGGPAGDQTCAALDGQPCPLVDEVDAVLNDIEDEATRLAIAEGMRATAPDVPMIVLMRPGVVRELEWLGPPWHWPEPSAVRFSPELRSAAELVGARSAGDGSSADSRHAA